MVDHHVPSFLRSTLGIYPMFAPNWEKPPPLSLKSLSAVWLGRTRLGHPEGVLCWPGGGGVRLSNGMCKCGLPPIYANLHTYIHTHTYTHTYTYICKVYVYIYDHMYQCKIHMYIPCMYIYIYIHHHFMLVDVCCVHCNMRYGQNSGRPVGRVLVQTLCSDRTSKSDSYSL